MKSKLLIGVLWLLALSTINSQLSTVQAQGTAFTYQGRLNSGSNPAAGGFDLRFALFDAATGGTQRGLLLTNTATAITNGLFTVTLDFGNQFPGTARWLEIAVRSNGVAAFTTLTPRQPLTPAPYATYAASAGGLLSGLTIQNNSSGAPNVVGGAANNYVASGVVGATISGGGATNYFGFAQSNAITADLGTIGGGTGNSINGQYSTISGGINNTANGYEATVGGGNANTVSSTVATVGGGFGNTVFGYSGTIGGGFLNNALADYSTISGGYCNTNNGQKGTIGGGQLNSVSGTNAIVGGGEHNTASGIDSAVSGGGYNTASGSYSIVGGGDANIAGGYFSTVGGGYANSVSGYGGTIGGGRSNTTSAEDATVSGGFDNQASGASSVVGGGYLNSAKASYSTIIGGSQNNVLGLYSTVLGGINNYCSGNYSCALGSNAQVSHNGACLWSDPIGQYFYSAADFEFAVRATGGVRFVSASSGGTPTAGVSLAPGSGTWASLSDRQAKENFQSVNAQAVLQQVAALPLTSWNYKTQARSIRHLGPMAQDFYSAFAVGEDERHITEIDESGVALAAIQGLNEKLEDKSKELEVRSQKLEVENAELKQSVAELKQLMRSLAEKK